MALLSVSGSGYAERAVDGVVDNFTNKESTTIFVRFKLPTGASSGDIAGIYGLDANANYDRYKVIYYDSATGNIEARTYSGSTNSLILGAATPGTWQTACLRNNSQTGSAFLDAGAIVVDTTMNTDSGNVTRLRVTPRGGSAAHGYFWRRALTDAEMTSLNGGAHPNTIATTNLYEAYPFVGSATSTVTGGTAIALYGDGSINSTDPYGLAPPTLTESFVADDKETAFATAFTAMVSVHDAATRDLLIASTEVAINNGQFELADAALAYSTEYLVVAINADRSSGRPFYSTTQVDPSL